MRKPMIDDRSLVSGQGGYFGLLVHCCINFVFALHDTPILYLALVASTTRFPYDSILQDWN